MYIHRIHPLLAPAGRQPGDWGGTTARLASLFTAVGVGIKGVMVGGGGGEDRQVWIGALLKPTNSGRLLRVGFSGHAPVVNMLASVLREI